MTPRVSILVTTYNQPLALAELCESLARQTERGFELIVVNDGGASVRHVAAAYPELTIRLVEPTANRGQTACLNTALSLARGEFVMTCDHDDMLEAHHLARMLHAIEGADLVFADAEVFDFEVTGGVRVPTRRALLAHHFDYGVLSRFLTFTPSGMLYRRRLHDAIGPFDESFGHCYWDWDFILRVAERHRIRRVPVASVYYAFGRGTNVSADHGAMRPRLEHLMAKHDLTGLKTTNFGLMVDDPELAVVRAPSLRVWDGRPMGSRLAPAAVAV